MNAGRVCLVPPRASLIAAVAERLPAGGRDFSRSWVVFPERRPAYYLRKYLAERTGSGFIPPRIFSLDAFADHVYSERLGGRGRPIDVLDAVAILLAIQRSAPERLGRDRFLSADHFFPLGVKLYHDLEELTAAGITDERLRSVDLYVQDAVSGAGPDLMTDHSRARLQNLSYFHERFLEALAESDFSTPALRLRTAAGGIERSLFDDADRFIFAGFFSLNKAEEDLLRRMLSGSNRPRPPSKILPARLRPKSRSPSAPTPTARFSPLIRSFGKNWPTPVSSMNARLSSCPRPKLFFPFISRPWPIFLRTNSTSPSAIL
jgi:ATP-dependent helicase/nuclease subunit B